MANFHHIFKMGENIKEKVSKRPTNVELVHKRAYKPGTFFWLPNRFHLTQCAYYTGFFGLIKYISVRTALSSSNRNCWIIKYIAKNGSCLVLLFIFKLRVKLEVVTASVDQAKNVIPIEFMHSIFFIKNYRLICRF